MATFHISNYFGSQWRNRLPLNLDSDITEVILSHNYFFPLKEQIKELEDTSN